MDLLNFDEGTFLAICIAAVVAVNQSEKIGIIKYFGVMRNSDFLDADIKKVHILTKVKTSTSHVKVFLAKGKGTVVMDNEWIEHCSATFENNLNNGDNPEYYYLNLKLRKDKWEKMALEKTKNPMTDFPGLRFQNIWSDQPETGNKSVLVSFTVKASELPGKLCEKYIFIHPIFINAMIQVISFIPSENIPTFEIGSNPTLNTCVKTFCILDKLKVSNDEKEELELYLFLRVFDDDNEQPANFSVWLINSKGTALAMMEGMTM